MKFPGFLLIICVIFYGASAIPTQFDHDKIVEYREKAKKMFYHAYDSYMTYAYPYDELRPLTCDGHNTWGSYSLSLIDSMDTLVILGNFSEFGRVVDIVLQKTDFDKDINVSVFETNIRVLGGLLSAHLFSFKGGLALEPGWPCDGPLLRLAEDVAQRLLPAFDTPTGMPYGTVNLRHGVPDGETPVTCTAGVGTFLVEFGTLSRLTGNQTYERAAVRAMDAIFSRRTPIGLIGNHINVKTGEWTAHDSGIGAGVDSYFEYLLKGGVLLQKLEYLSHLNEYEQVFEKYLQKEDWYVWANMKSGTATLPVFQSLEAFWPGLQSLKGDIDQAQRTILNYFQVWEQYGATPEFYSLTKLLPTSGREGYPLRPELIESAMYLYQATGDPQMLHIGATAIESIESIARTKCGYAVIHDVTNHKLANRMESFFLAETTKYLYLLFDHDNFIHNNGGFGTEIASNKGKCIIDTGGYVFNTEAHPVDMAAINCCYSPAAQQFSDILDDIDVVNAFDITETQAKRFHPTIKPESTKSIDEIKIREKLLTCKARDFHSKFTVYGEINPK